MSTFTRDWAELLTWTVLVETITGKDSFGNTGFSAPVEAQAHVDQTSSGATGVGGRSTVSTTTPTNTGTIYLGEPVFPGSRLTFPNGKVVDLRDVIVHYDIDGNVHHFEGTWEKDH